MPRKSDPAKIYSIGEMIHTDIVRSCNLFCSFVHKQNVEIRNKMYERVYGKGSSEGTLLVKVTTIPYKSTI